MKNWCHANCKSFDEQPTECFIEDIESHLQAGKYVIITKRNDVARVMICDSVDLADNHFICLHDFSYDDDCWSRFYYYNFDDELVGEIMYEWPVDCHLPFLMIWFDHDLGDLVLDSCCMADMVNEQCDDADLVTENVYFYYVS